MPFFACAGTGETFASSLLSRYSGSHSLYGAILLVIYVVMQTKKYVRDVGGGTDISVHTKDRAIAMRHPLIKPLEGMLEEIDKEFEGAFFTAFDVDTGSWLRSADYLKTKAEDIRHKLHKEMDRLFKAFSS